MKQPPTYTQQSHTTHLGDHPFTVRSLTPKLAEDERRETKRKIESGLYDIFRKYMT